MQSKELHPRIHSLRFDPHFTSDAPEVEEAIKRLLDEIVNLRSSANRRINDIESVRYHILVIVLNVFVSNLSYPYIYRAVSRRAPDYARPMSRYLSAKLSVHHITQVMDDLKELGYLDIHPGYIDREGGKSYSTRLNASPNLVQLLEDYGVNITMISRIGTEGIQLRDKYGDFVDYEETPFTHVMRANLVSINAAISKRRVHLALSNQEMDEFLARLTSDGSRRPFDLTAVALHRVFNNSSWEKGGRFYGGWWQNIPREFRPYIEIDFGLTVELDYSGLHIRMLYALEGLDCPDDPYDLSSYSRDNQKKAVLRILNADSIHSAVASLQSDGVQDASELCKKLGHRHAPIAKHFSTGIGTFLQFLDSRLAESVMLKIVALGGIALPVHDSFIVRAGREEELKSAMDEAFKEQFPNVSALYKRKETLLEIYDKQNPKKANDDFEFVELDDEALMTELERSGDFR